MDLPASSSLETSAPALAPPDRAPDDAVASTRGIGVLEVTQRLSAPLERVWPFFADASNLERITPRWLRFRVLTPLPIAMSEGTLIDYRLRWRGLPIRWRTRIARWDPPRSFVDEQLRGPYRLWRHTHTFERSGGQTVMRDRVEFRAPFGWISHPLIVRRDVARIFQHRRATLDGIDWATIER